MLSAASDPYFALEAEVAVEVVVEVEVVRLAMQAE
jgi:hypothetical protein